jgi:dephospho-CoA kinase
MSKARPQVPFSVIGLTGGIASGKSTVATHLRSSGVPVIDADLLARDVVEVGSPVLEAIRLRFGNAMIQTDGSLNRARLGAVVFRDSNELKALNAITHPAIVQRAEDAIRKARDDGFLWAIYEAALIIENEVSPELAGLGVVLCEPNLQRERIMGRDGLTTADAQRRIAAQTDNATRRHHATWILENNGSTDDLITRTDAWLETLRATFGPVR